MIKVFSPDTYPEMGPIPQPAVVAAPLRPHSLLELTGVSKALFVLACTLGFVALATQLFLGALYGGRFLPGVSVAGLQIGGLTRPEARQLLQSRIEWTGIQISAAGTTYKLKPADVGVEYDVNTTLDQASLVGREQPLILVALKGVQKSGNLAYSFHLDASREQALVDKIVSASGQAPLDASVVIQDGVPAVQPDKAGQSLDAKLVAQAIDVQIGAAQAIPIELKPQIQEARIRADAVKPAIEQTKALLATPVTITYQGKVFKPTPAQMGEWVSYEKTPVGDAPGLTPKINRDGIYHYLQGIAVQINIDPTNQKIRVENGNSSETQAGKNGLQLDQDALVDQLAKAVAIQQPFSVEAPTKPIAFKIEYNRTVSLDYGKYIEVNLSSQHLWVYENHNIIYESPLTSGAVGAGFGTVQGLFSIKAKQTNRNLNGYAIGYNYNVFVHYWMPFYADYGLHDASWRSSFGGQDYIYGGSHGCVNLPDATAAFLFGWADVGTPVWVHS